MGRSAGSRNARADKSSGEVDKYYRPVRGYHFLHTAIDAHSRLAYSELLGDERKDTAAAFWLRANAWFNEQRHHGRKGVDRQRFLLPITRVRETHWVRSSIAEPAPTTQTNGKVERFHRTLADEWAYARLYTSDGERCDEFPRWLHTYNYHRGHTALGGQPPATRVPNLQVSTTSATFGHSLPRQRLHSRGDTSRLS